MSLNLSTFFPALSKAGNKKSTKEKDAIAELLKTDATAMERFGESYQKHVLNKPYVSDNLFDLNAKQAVRHMKSAIPLLEENKEAGQLVEDIVGELLQQTAAYVYDRETDSVHINEWAIPEKERVTPKQMDVLPEELRPQLTGYYTKKDLSEPSYKILALMYGKYKTEKDPSKKQMFYHQFRQGLDILDLDSVTYEMISRNPNSIGNWFPALVEAARKQDFFKIPSTTIINVPITLLQLTRLDYPTLTPTTLQIVDRYCQEAFQLNPDKEYFIKTGTYSSKYDFRNAHVAGPQEVMELGEYLLFIHFQAIMAAGPLSIPSIYGMSTTTEWCVREFIPSSNKNIPSIYKGLPLRTEYRIFVDFTPDDGTDPKIIGYASYWDSNLMKNRFSQGDDSDTPHQVHDYMIYKAHEDYLLCQYQANIVQICRHVEEMLPDIRLTGQWSLDIMQDGQDFWLIDMARAEESALNNCINPGVLRHEEVDWLPNLTELLLEENKSIEEKK